jgi:Domain of unknown function (DUF1844)
MSEGEGKTIRVVDRRMFTPEGDLREGFEAEESSEPSPPPPANAAGAPAAAAPLPPEPAGSGAPGAPDSASTTGGEPETAPPTEPRSDFARIVSSLATTAYAALGLLTDPATGARHRDLAVARQMIDWLAVLEQKTRGNLSFEESDLLSRVLYELRLAYVEVGRAPK